METTETNLLDYLNITDEDLKEHKVADLATRPNEDSQPFGVQKLTAEELKKHFDKYSNLLRTRFNALLEALLGEEAYDTILNLKVSQSQTIKHITDGTAISLKKSDASEDTALQTLIKEIFKIISFSQNIGGTNITTLHELLTAVNDGSFASILGTGSDQNALKTLKKLMEAVGSGDFANVLMICEKSNQLEPMPLDYTPQKQSLEEWISELRNLLGIQLEITQGENYTYKFQFFNRRANQIGNDVELTLPFSDFLNKLEQLRLNIKSDENEYKYTFSLLDGEKTLGDEVVIDLPLESVVVKGEYKEYTESDESRPSDITAGKYIILSLKNGTVIHVPLGDLISGLASESALNEKLNKQTGQKDKSFAYVQEDEESSLVEISAEAEAETIAKRDTDGNLCAYDFLFDNEGEAKKISEAFVYQDAVEKAFEDTTPGKFEGTVYGIDKKCSKAVRYSATDRATNSHRVVVTTATGRIKVPDSITNGVTLGEYAANINDVRALTEPLAQRVDYLEGAVLKHSSVTDTAYEVTVPSGAASKAFISSVGGMTYLKESKNLAKPINGYHIVTNGDVYISSFSGPYIEINLVTLPAGTYSYHIECISGNSIIYLGIPSFMGPFTSGIAFTLTKTTTICVYVEHDDTEQVFDDEFKIMLNEGGSVLPYEPFYDPLLEDTKVTAIESLDANGEVIDSYTIPAKIQALDGYGLGIEGHYNTVDFDRKKLSKKVKEIVLTGDESWTVFDTSGLDASLRYFYFKIGEYGSTVKGAVESNVFDSVVISSNTYNAGIYITNSSIGEDRLIIRPEGVESFTLESFRQLLRGNPVTVVYALTTPEEVDLSEHLTDYDKLLSLPVEPGGRIRFVNEHERAVTSTVDYLIPKI